MFCNGCPSVGLVRPFRLFVPYNFLRQCRPCVRSVLAVRPRHAPSVRIVKPHHYHQRRTPQQIELPRCCAVCPLSPDYNVGTFKTETTRKQKGNLTIVDSGGKRAGAKKGEEAEGDSSNRKKVVGFWGGQFSRRISMRSAKYWHWK